MMQQTVNKNVKDTKIMELVKTWDQHPHKFNFCQFFRALRVIALFLSGDIKNLGESSAWETWVKMTGYNFWFANSFSNNMNIINLKFSLTMVVYTGFIENSTNVLERDKALRWLVLLIWNWVLLTNFSIIW